jgi:hypothetical protein
MKKLVAIAGVALALTTAAHAESFTQAQIDAAAKGFNVPFNNDIHDPLIANKAYCHGFKSMINYWRSLARDGSERHIQQLQREMQTYTDMGCMAYDQPSVIGEKL